MLTQQQINEIYPDIYEEGKERAKLKDSKTKFISFHLNLDKEGDNDSIDFIFMSPSGVSSETVIIKDIIEL